MSLFTRPSDAAYFLNAVDELWAIVASDGAILEHEGAWERLLGHDAAALRSRTLDALTTDDARAALSAAVKLAASAPPGADAPARTFPLRGADGRVHTCRLWLAPGGEGRVLVRARPWQDTEASAEAKRAAMLSRLIDTAPIVIWQVDRDGVFQLSEGGGLTTLGLQPGQVVGLSAFELYKDVPDAIALVRRGLAGEETKSISDVNGTFFSSLHRPLRDERGEVVGVMAASLDVTAQLQMERALEAQARELAEQRRWMQAMATPILQVWDGVLCVPIIGHVDQDRAASMTDAILSAVQAKGARHVILDLTGLEQIDTDTASHFVRILSAVELLGARGIVVGIRAAVAQTLVDLGVELRIETLGRLQDALVRLIKASTRAPSGKEP